MRFKAQHLTWSNVALEASTVIQGRFNLEFSRVLIKLALWLSKSNVALLVWSNLAPILQCVKSVGDLEGFLSDSSSFDFSQNLRHTNLMHCRDLDKSSGLPYLFQEFHIYIYIYIYIYTINCVLINYLDYLYPSISQLINIYIHIYYLNSLKLLLEMLIDLIN